MTSVPFGQALPQRSSGKAGRRAATGGGEQGAPIGFVAVGHTPCCNETPTVIHLQVEITECGFPAPGVYWFQVVFNEKLVAERPFIASDIPGATNGQPLS